MTQMTKQCIAEGTVEDQRVPARCNQLSDRSIFQHAHAYDMICFSVPVGLSQK